MDCFIVMHPHLIAWHETKLAKVQYQHPLVLMKCVSTSVAWALHTLIGKEAIPWWYEYSINPIKP
jgi:hypothetical protein